MSEFKKVISATLIPSNGKWNKWKVILEGSEGAPIDLGAPKEIASINPGDFISTRDGSYGPYITPKDIRTADSVQKGGGEKKFIASSTEYWEHKSSYEENERDPKIEFQTYFDRVSSFYSPMASKTIEERRKLLLLAFQDANRLFNIVNPEKAKVFDTSSFFAKFVDPKAEGKQGSSKPKQEEPEQYEDDDDEIPF